jgi:hypothetical protein
MKTQITVPQGDPALGVDFVEFIIHRYYNIFREPRPMEESVFETTR